MVTLQYFFFERTPLGKKMQATLAGQGDGQPVGYHGRTDDYAYLYV